MFTLDPARLPQRIGQNGIEVVGQVAVDGTGQGCHQPEEQFKVPKVQFNEHAGIVKMILKRGNEFLHVLAGLSQ